MKCGVGQSLRLLLCQRSCLIHAAGHCVGSNCNAPGDGCRAGLLLANDTIVAIKCNLGQVGDGVQPLLLVRAAPVLTPLLPYPRCYTSVLSSVSVSVRDGRAVVDVCGHAVAVCAFYCPWPFIATAPTPSLISRCIPWLFFIGCCVPQSMLRRRRRA